MKRKSCLTLCGILYAALFVNAVSAQAGDGRAEKSLADSLSVNQRGSTVGSPDNRFTIQNEPFELRFADMDANSGAFIYVSREPKDIPVLPLAADESEFFCVGHTVIRDRSEKDVTLYFDSERKNTYVGFAGLVGEDGVARVRIGGFAETANADAPSRELHCAVYVDRNGNKLIEPAEVAQFSIVVEGQGPLFGKKIYISTMGYWVTSFNSRPADYRVYKITSKDGYERFKREVTPMTSNYSFFFEEKGGSALVSECFYIVHSPVTKEAFLDQPYKYAGRSELVFEVVPSSRKQGGEYIAARNYQVKRNQDVLRICVLENGRMIYPTVYEY